MAEFTDVNGVVSIRDSNGKPRLIVAADGGLRTRDSINENDGAIGTPTTSAIVLRLTGSTLVGDASITVAGGTPPGLFKNSIIAIDAGTTECELRALSATPSSGTLSFTTPLLFSHAANDVVRVTTYGQVGPEDFGAVNDGTDAWTSIQRMFIEAANNAAGIVSSRGGIEGAAQYSVSKPVGVISGSRIGKLNLKTRAGFAPTDTTNALGSNNVWLMNVSNGFATVASADASTDTITTSAAHGMGGAGSFAQTNHSAVMFVAPYGETLPGGITEGVLYYINTLVSTTSFTISATKGGSILDITSDGTAKVFCQVGEAARLYADNLRLDLSVADISGMFFCSQQPAFVSNLRVEMDANATTSAVGLSLGGNGQIGEWGSVEINPSANCTCLYVSGSGHHFNYFNCNGVQNGDIGVYVAGGNAIRFDYLWTETCSVGVKLDGAVRALHIGTWLLAVSSTVLPGFWITSNGLQGSYKVDLMMTTSGSNIVMVQDDGRSITLKSWGGGTTGASDNGFVLGGIRQMNNGSVSPVGPELIDRIYRGVSADYTARYIDKTVDVNATGGAKTVTLPTAAFWAGWRVTVRKNDASANAVTVATTSAQTINGAATASLAAQYNFVEVESNGTNWMIVNQA